MIKKYIRDVIVCIKSIRITYPVFLSFFAFEILYKNLGMNQYSFIELVRLISINSLGNIHIQSLVAKHLIGVLISVVFYISIYYWVFRNLYGQKQLKVSYGKLFGALWFKFLIIMAVVSITQELIVDVVSKTDAQLFIIHLFIFILVILKRIIIFFALGYVTKQFITGENKDERAKCGNAKELFAGMGLLLICGMVVGMPISYYLMKSTYDLLFTSMDCKFTMLDLITSNNGMSNGILTVISFIFDVFITFYYAFIYLYITNYFWGKYKSG